jgi:hypothetical protein
MQSITIQQRLVILNVTENTTPLNNAYVATWVSFMLHFHASVEDKIEEEKG